MTTSQCEHDFHSITVKTKRDVLYSLDIHDSFKAFGNIDEIIALKVCLKCQEVVDEIEAYRVQVMANLQDYEFVKNWPFLRERLANYIYKEKLITQSMNYHGAA